MDNYESRGVSATKEDVYVAIQNLEPGLGEKTFCKVYPDYLTGDPDYCLISHADGAGTKSVLAYLYWRETGDMSAWDCIAQDAIVMNTDDLLCVGATDNLCFTSTIGRNRNLIPGEVISKLIDSNIKFFNKMKNLGININYMGGETADVGDVVRTIIVDGNITCRLERKKLIDNKNIKVGNVIVGFSSFGQATYEDYYNSGIGSNGLTSARHDILSKYYEMFYPESFDPQVDESLRFVGKFKLSDVDPIVQSFQIGKLLLSPTRTYLPVVKKIIESLGVGALDGIIHCSGGGQTKILNFIESLTVVKDNLFEPPPIFKLIKYANSYSNAEMYKVFNMGHRLEIYTDPVSADKMIEISESFNIDAKIIGQVENFDGENRLIIKNNSEQINYK